MISFSQIQAFRKQIVEEFQPERTILFSFFAYGQPTEDSDIDLLVILPFKEMPVQVERVYPVPLFAEGYETVCWIQQTR